MKQLQNLTFIFVCVCLGVVLNCVSVQLSSLKIKIVGVVGSNVEKKNRVRMEQQKAKQSFSMKSPRV